MRRFARYLVIFAAIYLLLAIFTNLRSYRQLPAAGLRAQMEHLSLQVEDVDRASHTKSERRAYHRNQADYFKVYAEYYVRLLYVD